jgi:hypothetical protein
MAKTGPAEAAPASGAAPADQGQAGPVALSPELAGLAAEAAGLEVPADGAAPGAPGDAPGVSVSEELLSALVMARLVVSPMFAWWPDFERVWADATLRGISQAGAQVMERHGWTMGQLMGQWGPYIGLIAAAAPPAFVTYKAIQQQRESEARPAPGGRSDGSSGPA